MRSVGSPHGDNPRQRVHVERHFVGVRGMERSQLAEGARKLGDLANERLDEAVLAAFNSPTFGWKTLIRSP